MIEELDNVVLKVDLPEFGLRAGDVGTVVHVCRDNVAYEVEFMTLRGETIAVETMKPDHIRPVGPREVTHARIAD